MSFKKTLGSLFFAFVFGIISYLVFLFISVMGGQFSTKVFVVFGTIGLLFIVFSIALIRITKEKV